MYAETEFSLAMLVDQRKCGDEAMELFDHAVAVLQAQVPNHPILAMLRDAEAQQPPPSRHVPTLAPCAPAPG